MPVLYPVSRASLVFAFGLALGCGEAAPPPAKAPAAAAVAEKAAAPPPVVPPGHVARQDVELALTRLGPGWLFHRVMRTASYDKAGKFAGWKLIGLPEEWSSVDLRPGDVVVRVNGLSLERPEDVWEAWKSVAKAREIRLSLERDGAPKELLVPIDGAPTAAVIEALDRDTPPPRPPEERGRNVVRIGGDEEEEGGGGEGY